MRLGVEQLSALGGKNQSHLGDLEFWRIGDLSYRLMKTEGHILHQGISGA